MRLGTKADYGIRALIDLALHSDEGPVRRAAIAERQRIPEAYLDHLLAQLRRDGFIRSMRGPSGGHQLTRPPDDICMLHVLESLEGSLAPLGCLGESESEDEHDPLCGQQWVWREIYDDMRRKLASVSIADLASRERERTRATAAASYSI